MIVDPDILGSIPTRSYPGLPDTWLWWVGFCILDLLPKVGSKGSCLGEVPENLLILINY